MITTFLNHASTIALSAGAVVLFQTATLVIGGHLAKDLLDPFYQALPQWWLRMLAVIVPLSGIGNLLATTAYTNPIVAGVSFLIFGNWAALFTAAYIGKAQFDFLSLGLITIISTLSIFLSIRIS